MIGKRSPQVRIFPLSFPPYFNLFLFSEFDKLARMVQRQQNLSELVPAFYIKALVNLENAVNDTLVKEKQSSKKMNASNAKALTAMKNKIKKTVKEFETDIKRYQAVSLHPSYGVSHDASSRIRKLLSRNMLLVLLSNPLHRLLLQQQHPRLPSPQMTLLQSARAERLFNCSYPEIVFSSTSRLFKMPVERR